MSEEPEQDKPGFLSLCSSLDEEEIRNATRWYNFLRVKDRRNVDTVLTGADDWINPYNPRNYFIISAIGSTARREPQYKDVDLLVVTDKELEELDDIGDLERRLCEYFEWETDFDPGEAYKFRDKNRAIVTLTPSLGTDGGEIVHLTIQAGIASEIVWDMRDREERVLLYRKNVSEDSDGEDSLDP